MSSSLAPLLCLMCIVTITRLMLGVHQPDPPGLIHDDPRLLPPWRGSSPFYRKFGKARRSSRPVGGCGIPFSVTGRLCRPLRASAHSGCAIRSDRVLSACTRAPEVWNGRVDAPVRGACRCRERREARSRRLTCRQSVETTVEGSVVTGRVRGTHAVSSAKTRRSTCTAAGLSNGSLPLPHFGDCTHEGQPCGHSHASIASAVADNHVAA
jgi:hypothetical protein